MTQREIEDLPEAQCLELLRQERVGRLVFIDGDGPGAVPVNYAVVSERILFRTAESSHLREVLASPVAFEVDHTEPASGAGWSVLVRGSGAEVPHDELPALLHEAGAAFPKPWGSGVHNIWVAIAPRKVTGRRLEIPYLPAIF